ncbi:hypothetical protein OROMI_023936 [Orobanche minor]
MEHDDGKNFFECYDGIFAKARSGEGDTTRNSNYSPKLQNWRSQSCSYPSPRFYNSELRMDDILGQDLISDLPQEIILAKLPLGDAVRTSILSSRWRYKWAALTQLVFDDKCLNLSQDKTHIEEKLVNFVTRFLFLHSGPIHTFAFSTSYLQSSPDIDQ